MTKPTIGALIYKAMDIEPNTPISFWAIKDGMRYAHLAGELKDDDIIKIMSVFLNLGINTDRRPAHVLDDVRTELNILGIKLKTPTRIIWGDPLLAELIENLFYVIREGLDIIKKTHTQEKEASNGTKK